MQTFGHGRAHLAPEGRHVYSVKRDKNTADARRDEGICLSLQS